MDKCCTSSRVETSTLLKNLQLKLIIFNFKIQFCRLIDSVFVGKPHHDSSHPDYVPSVFPTAYKKALHSEQGLIQKDITDCLIEW